MSCLKIFNCQTFPEIRHALKYFFTISVDAMKRVEEIKGKRQAQYIFDRQKKARKIEKEKDIKEVQRDMALIRSPAAGMKRAAKEMEVEEDMEEEDKLEEETASASTSMDTSLNLAARTK